MVTKSKLIIHKSVIYFIQKIVDDHQQIYNIRETLALQEVDIHVNTGQRANSTVEKIKIIVGLLVEMEIMLEVHGVIHLVVEKPGIGVTYQYVEVSKFIPIHTIRSGVKQISEDSLELIKSRFIFSYNSIKTFH